MDRYLIKKNKPSEPSEIIVPLSDSESSDTHEAEAKKTKRKFRSAWLSKFPWLQNNDGSSFCIACEKKIANNVTYLNKHSKLSCHLQNVERKKDQVNIESCMNVEKQQLSQQVRQAELTLVMFLICHNLPFLLMDSLPSLIKECCPDSKIAAALQMARTKSANVAEILAEAQFRPGGPNRFGPPRPGGSRQGGGGPGGPPPFGFQPRPGLPGPGPRPPGPIPPGPIPPPLQPPVPRPPPVQPPPTPQPQPQPQLDNLRLCTFTEVAQNKCLYTLQAAANASIYLKLQCVQNSSFAACLSAIQTSAADLVVADDHDYKAARAANLTTVLYAHESLTDYYVAVAPSNITLIELEEAAIDVNVSNHRAFDAAAFFNLQRGHDICRQSARDTVTIQIVNTAEYNATGDELLICANRSVAEWSDYSTCNVEASLERAVFAAKPLAANAAFRCLVQSTFDRILNSFGPASSIWNFFADFQNTTDVIFKNNTIGFSQSPIIRNGVTEQLFSQLHCNNLTAHDSSELE